MSSRARYPMPMPFGWFQVAWSDEVDKGAAKPLFFFDRHLIAWRDDEGQAASAVQACAR